MKQVILTQNKNAIIDDIDIDILNNKWCLYNGYAGRRKEYKNIYMHRIIMERILNRKLIENECVDHIDQNRLNNTRSNLRLATRTQNQINRNGHKNSSSIYKGVSFFKRNNNWSAQININKIKVHIGYFKTEIEAAEAYDKYAKLYHGEFANLNFK